MSTSAERTEPLGNAHCYPFRDRSRGHRRMMQSKYVGNWDSLSSARSSLLLVPPHPAKVTSTSPTGCLRMIDRTVRWRPRNLCGRDDLEDQSFMGKSTKLHPLQPHLHIYSSRMTTRTPHTALAHHYIICDRSPIRNLTPRLTILSHAFSAGWTGVEQGGQGRKKPGTQLNSCFFTFGMLRNFK